MWVNRAPAVRYTLPLAPNFLQAWRWWLAIQRANIISAKAEHTDLDIHAPAFPSPGKGARGGCPWTSHRLVALASPVSRHFGPSATVSFSACGCVLAPPSGPQRALETDIVCCLPTQAPWHTEERGSGCLLSPFTQTFAFSLSPSPHSVFEHEYKIFLRKQLLIRAREWEWAKLRDTVERPGPCANQPAL